MPVNMGLCKIGLVKQISFLWRAYKSLGDKDKCMGIIHLDTCKAFNLLVLTYILTKVY